MKLPPHLAESGLLIPLTALIIYLGLLAIGRRLKRDGGVRFGFLFQLFCIAAAIYLAVRWIEPGFGYLRELLSAVVLLSPSLVVPLLDRFLWKGHFLDQRNVKIPKFFPEVVSIIIFLVALTTVLGALYDVRIPGLVAGSGIAAIILGLAMQDLLGNIISGFAIHSEKPFKEGDWLLLDNQHVEVIEINWRATRFRNNDDVYLDIPNNNLAKQTIVNLYYPTREHAMRLLVHAEYSIPPNRVKDILVRATEAAPGVLHTPRPRVFLKDFGESAIIYEVKYYLDNHQEWNAIADAVRTNIWYEFVRSKITIPYPIRTVQVERRQAGRTDRVDVARMKLQQQPIFSTLDEETINTLVRRSVFYQFGRGEHIIHQGAEGNTMFVLLRGEASVMVSRSGRPVHVAALMAGQCFGEMSLLTGEKRSASVIADSDCEVVEISKEGFGEILAREPELLNKLSELLANRRMQNEGILSTGVPSQEMNETERKYRESFLVTLRSFFEL